jgi:sortase (surface protein transpeptidase)
MVMALSATALVVATACSGSTGVATPPTSPALTTTASTAHARTTTPPPAALGRSTPVRLRIPDIGVDSRLMDLGLRADGSLQVPPSGFPAGWYTGGPTPGELGPAVVAGHVDWKGPGVFVNLHKLKPGELVVISRADGSQPTFRVSRVARYPKDQFPTALVYGDLDHAGLRLITCGGSFNSRTGHYEDNVVVFADLVTPTDEEHATR